MTYHSQNNEASIVLQYFAGFTGNVLDIGANDGITFSNSYDLIQKGWPAYCLEPGAVCGDLFLLHKDNPNVRIFNYGIGEREDTITFYQSGAHVPGGSDTGLVSTTIKSETKRWSQAGVEFTEVPIQIVPFDKFYEQADKPQFHFISIDVEGMDWMVLQQIDLAQVGCRCLCIEHNGNSALLAKYTAYAAKYGLKEIARNAENVIYGI